MYTNNPHKSLTPSRSSTRGGQGMACVSFIFSESWAAGFLKSCSSLIPRNAIYPFTKTINPLASVHHNYLLETKCILILANEQVFDVWISHTPLDSHNHWQYVCNVLEETAVYGFHVQWKSQNIRLISKFLALERRTPWRCIVLQPAGAVVHDILCKRIWSAEVEWISCVRRLLSSLSSRKTYGAWLSSSKKFIPRSIWVLLWSIWVFYIFTLHAPNTLHCLVCEGGLFNQVEIEWRLQHSMDDGVVQYKWWQTYVNRQ